MHRISSGPWLTALLFPLLISACGGGSAGGNSSSFRANDDTFEVAQGGSLTVPAPGVLANDTNRNGGTLTATLARNVAHGTLMLNIDGSFTYQHDGSTSGDSFVYRASNGTGTTAEATVTLTFAAGLAARNSCHSLSMNAPYTSQLSATGHSLTYEIMSQPDKGSLSTDAAGNFTYVPRSGVRGRDRFTFRVRDAGGQESNPATVSLFIDGSLRVMPLGDSITLGTLTASTPGPGESVGYRRRLYNDLTAFSGNRYGINFVGSQTDGQSASPAIDDANHEGWGGACAGPACSPYPALSDNIRSWLDANSADIVLLHAGINDLNQRGDTSASGISAILDQIDAWESTNHPVTVYVAQIIKDVPGFQNDLPVHAFNDSVASIVNARPNDRVVLVNMEDGAGLNYGNGQLGPDMADNYHPSAAGYDKIAAKWYADLTNNAGTLPECQ